MKNSFKHKLFLAFAFSVSVNVLFLVSPIYMLQVYDRVLTSGSESTLYSLSLIACFLLIIFAFADAGRKRAMAQAGHIYSTLWTTRLAKQTFSTQAIFQNKINHQDIERVTSLLQNGGIFPLLDLPFAPLFFLTLFLLHPFIGWLGIVGVVILILFALLGERVSGARILQDQRTNTDIQRTFKTSFAASNAIIAHGMRDRILQKWLQRKQENDIQKIETLSLSGLFSGISKSLRLILQTLILGAGAYMVLQQQMSPGAMIAGSIIIGRGLAPIDQIIGSWRSLSLAHEAWAKIKDVENNYDVEAIDELPTISTPRPETGLKLSRMAVTIPGRGDVIVSPFSYHFQSGKSYAIIGKSGSGKTTLLRTLAGVLPPRSGGVLLGDRDVYNWPEADRGQYVGYLPQNIELVIGTVADNINRFTACDDQTLHETCQKMGALKALTALPKAFETMIDPDHMTLSAGQQQIIGLARSFFGRPPLLILDEPTSNLDTELANTVIGAINCARDEGAVAIIATHDPKVILNVDYVLTLTHQTLTPYTKTDYINMMKAGVQRNIEANQDMEQVKAQVT